jgi:hypothetical protein
MRNSRVALTLFAFSIFATCAAQAQATRTWVSGVGDDANPCSVTAPCKTFAGAISKTAAGGEIDALTPGGYGTLTITKAITIDGGEGQVASVLASGTPGITVAAGTADIVTLRNLDFQGITGTGEGGTIGIDFTSGAALHIEHCAIQNFTGNGIQISAGAGNVFIDGTVSRGNGGDGLYILGNAVTLRVSVTNSHFSDNGANGILSADRSSTAVFNSDANGNKTNGFNADGGSSGAASLSIANSIAANNLGSGVSAGGGGSASTVNVSNVSLFGNGSGFTAGAHGTINSFGNNANGGTGTPNAHIALQ